MMGGREYQVIRAGTMRMNRNVKRKIEDREHIKRRNIGTMIVAIVTIMEDKTMAIVAQETRI